MVRKLLTAALCLCAALACQVDEPGFTCDTSAQCAHGAATGVCEATGACSFPDDSCPDPGRRYGSHGPDELRDRCVELPPFEERFTWLGLHASTLPDRSSNTVWWPPDTWDVRGRTAFLAYARGYHVDIRRSSADLTDGLPRDDLLLIGGDGGPGVGIMHFEGFGAVSARLRNPGLVESGTPLEVELYANRVTTIGDHWEVVLTPRDSMVGAEHAAVALWNLGEPADSVAIGVQGYTAFPCDYGWEQTLEMRIASGGAIQELEAPRLPGDPADRGRLSRWRFRFFPDHVEAWADIDDAGSLNLMHTFPAGVPWREVHVHLVALGNAADDYPADDECGDYYRSGARDIAWKAVRVNPLLYGSTSVHPRQQGTDRVETRTGWRGHDIRDLQRFGAVDGLSQPNAGPYAPETSYAFCTDAAESGCEGAVSSRVLEVEIAEAALERAAHAQLNYDVRGVSEGRLFVNEEEVGELPNRSLEGLEGPEWQRRAVLIPVEALRAGLNRVRIDVPGSAQYARLEIEIAKGR